MIAIFSIRMTQDERPSISDLYIAIMFGILTWFRGDSTDVALTVDCPLQNLRSVPREVLEEQADQVGFDLSIP